MSPNIILPFMYIVQPKRMFTRKEESKEEPETRHCTEPVAGTYNYKPGRGWFLVAVDTAYGQESIVPQPIVWSRVLRRYLLETEYRHRIVQGKFLDGSSNQKEVGFFRLDDGISWVNCFDHEGLFVPGHYQRFVIDQMSGKFRPMLKGDNPDWVAQHTSKQSEDGVHSSATSIRSGITLNSCHSACVSRRNSTEFDEHDRNTAKSSPSRSSTLDSHKTTDSHFLEVPKSSLSRSKQ